MRQAAKELEQARKARARLRMIQHYEQVSRNVSQTCRFFGISRTQFYIWLGRYREAGSAGLRDRPRGPHRSPAQVRHRQNPPHALRAHVPRGPAPCRSHPFQSTDADTQCQRHRISFPTVRASTRRRLTVRSAPTSPRRSEGSRRPCGNSVPSISACGHHPGGSRCAGPANGRRTSRRAVH